MGPNDMDHVPEPNSVRLTLYYNIILQTNVKEEL